MIGGKMYDLNYGAQSPNVWDKSTQPLQKGINLFVAQKLMERLEELKRKKKEAPQNEEVVQEQGLSSMAVPEVAEESPIEQFLKYQQNGFYNPEKPQIGLGLSGLNLF